MSYQSNIQTNSQSSIGQAGRIFANAISQVQEWRARFAMRKALGGATDRQLRDAGLIRQDVEGACELPLTRSAASAIRTSARIRSANW